MPKSEVTREGCLQRAKDKQGLLKDKTGLPKGEHTWNIILALGARSRWKAQTEVGSIPRNRQAGPAEAHGACW